MASDFCASPQQFLAFVAVQWTFETKPERTLHSLGTRSYYIVRKGIATNEERMLRTAYDRSKGRYYINNTTPVRRTGHGIFRSLF